MAGVPGGTLVEPTESERRRQTDDVASLRVRPRRGNRFVVVAVVTVLIVDWIARDECAEPSGHVDVRNEAASCGMATAVATSHAGPLRQQSHDRQEHAQPTAVHSCPLCLQL